MLLGDAQEILGEKENALLQSFLLGANLPDDQQVETLVVFPNIHYKQVQASRFKRNIGEAQWAGKEILQPEANWNDFFSALPMGALQLEKLRQRFTPEVVVPADLTVRPDSGTQTGSGFDRLPAGLRSGTGGQERIRAPTGQSGAAFRHALEYHQRGGR